MRAGMKYNDDDIDEDMKLTRQDYLKILHHYQPREPRNRSVNSNKSLRSQAHRILASKLCRCIKAKNKAKNGAISEKQRIGYCSRSIFNNRGLHQHGFRCKTERGNLRPKLTRDITKTVRRLRIRSKGY